jgi:hypothetical protein
LIKLIFSDSVESHDLNKMQHDTPDILFSLFKMTFNLRGSFNQEFSFIIDCTETENVNFIGIYYKKFSFYILSIKLNSWFTEPDKINISNSVWSDN